MLKYSEFINQLSDSDKVHMLCDIHSLADKKYKVLGIPTVTFASLEEYCQGEYPSPIALANSWDPALVSRVGDRIFKNMAEQSVDVATVTGPKIKINPCRPALSEDPFLASRIGASFCGAADRFGIAVGLSGFSVSADELEWMDRDREERFIYEYFVKPYVAVISAARNVAVLTATDLDKEGYKTVNSDLVQMLASKSEGRDIPCVYKKLSSDETVHHLSHGGLCFEGSALALESALARYKQLQKGIEFGSSTAEDLRLEILKGRAISPEMLDEAVDRLLSFAFSVKRKPAVSEIETDSDIAVKAYRESAVLLKNEKQILPMRRGAKVAVIGDVAFGEEFLPDLTERLAADGYILSGTEKGYRLDAERSEDMIPPALSLAADADVILLFLGLGAERAKRTAKTGKISIPANQQALLDELGIYRSKIVAILPPDCTPDVSFPENCAAILFASVATKTSAIALTDLLSGAVSPSGRLASTAYCHTEALHVKHKTYRERDGLKTGPYVGYRYYDTANNPPDFPFGHGLSYTQFAYSNPSIENGVVRFTVANVGKCAGAEVAQLYVGMPESSVLRPDKELCGFAKINLAAGERKTVEIPLTLPEVYDGQKDAFVEEVGLYTVYIGASVTDIRLTQTLSAGREQLARDEKKRSDYIQTESNIISDNYKLEAKIKAMKKSVFNYIVGALALLFAIVLKMYCAYVDVGGVFFDVFAIALGLFGVIFFVVEAIRRNRMHSEERATVDARSREEFSDAESVEVYSADKMFVKEFDTVEEEQTAVVEDRVEGVDAERLAYVDKDQSFENAAREFEIFAAERGCKFAPDTVKNIFASIASSRLLVTYGMEESAFKKLMLLLTGYFETAAHIDRVDTAYNESGSVLFKNDPTNGRAKTNVLAAIESAGNIKHAIHFAALDNVVPADLPQYFTAYVNYVKNPLGNSHVTVLNDRGAETSYYIPKNLWFVLNLAKNEMPDGLPGFVSEVATVNHFAFSECQSSAQHTHVRKFSYYQLEHLTDKATSKVSVSEDLWKKIDRIEEFTNKRIPFALGNKVWLCLEKYAYVYISCNGDAVDAVDHAAAAKLMASVLAALKGKITTDERSISETVEMILGEDHAEACKRLIKDCESAVHKA